MDRQALSDHLDRLLAPAPIDDYCPNGLQVEGRAEVRTLVTGVTASQALIDATIEVRADALLVHHGLFWRGDSGRLTGYRRARVAGLIRADINLFAYHLPLDVHAELGNNTQLGLRLGLERTGSIDRAGLIAVGRVLAETAADRDAEHPVERPVERPVEPSPGRSTDKLTGPTTLAGLAVRVGQVLGRPPLVVGEPDRPIVRIGWCTGGGQRFIEDAWPHVDAFLTGEVSEQTVHVARECGVALICAGHHATERYGVQAVGDHLARSFGLQHRFIDIDNPA
jgi:dinuclear metal center YbgI/SA1388 family protein